MKKMVLKTMVSGVFMFAGLCALLTVACGQLGYKNPHEKRTLTVTNSLTVPINGVVIKSRYNSDVHFNGTLEAVKTLTLKDVPLCITNLDSAYDLKIDKANELGDNPYWTIRKLKDSEKIKIAVYNHLVADVKLTYKLQNTQNVYIPGSSNGDIELPKQTDSVPSFLSLYDSAYDFHLNNEQKYYTKKNDGSFDMSKKYFALKRNAADVPPEWSADPANPADKDKIPIFFVIEYNKNMQRIDIREGLSETSDSK